MRFLTDPNRKWCFMDLVTNHQTGKLRETALFSVVCKTAMTIAFLYQVFKEGATFNEGLWMIYGGYLIAHEVYKAKQNQDQQKLDKEHAAQPSS